MWLSRQETPKQCAGSKKVMYNNNNNINVGDDNDDDDDDDDDDAASILCEPAQSKCTWTCHKRHLRRNLQGKCRTPYAYAATSVLCEPVQSKCTWTCRKRHFAQKCTGKMPDASDTSIEQRPLTVTARTPQCGLSVWGIFHSYDVSVQEGSHLSVLLVGSAQLGNNQPTTSHILFFFAGEASGVCPNTLWTIWK